METLERDLGQLAIQTKSKGSSFLDVVGADVDSSYERPIIFQVVQDTYHISQGGQNVGENANIQIQIDDDNCIHYLHKYAIVADLYTKTDVITGFIENAAALFEGLELMIGSVQWSCPQQRFYAQQKLSLLGKKRLEKVASGLALKHDNFSIQGDISQNNWVGSGGNANTNLQFLQSYVRQIVTNAFMRTDIDAAGDERVKIVVPLPLIFPALWELPDDGAVLTTLGQKIKANIKTNLAIDCMMSNGAIPQYVLKNVSLARFYSKLDSVRTDLCLKSTIMLPKLNYVLYPINSVTPVLNPIFPISAKDRVRGLVFGFHTKKQSNNAGDDANLIANYLNTTATMFKYPLGYYPYIPIQQIDVLMGGETYSLNMSNIQFIHLSNYFGDQKESYGFALQRQMKYAYYIDLTRFGNNEDLYGSSAKQVTSISFQITIKTDTGSRTLYLQGADWSTATLSNFQFYGFLETQQMIECRNGYYNIV